MGSRERIPLVFVCGVSCYRRHWLYPLDKMAEPSSFGQYG